MKPDTLRLVENLQKNGEAQPAPSGRGSRRGDGSRVRGRVVGGSRPDGGASRVPGLQARVCGRLRPGSPRPPRRCRRGPRPRPVGPHRWHLPDPLCGYARDPRSLRMDCLRTSIRPTSQPVAAAPWPRCRPWSRGGVCGDSRDARGRRPIAASSSHVGLPARRALASGQSSRRRFRAHH